MLRITGIRRHWRTSAVAVLAATLTLGSLAGSASAEERDWHHRDNHRRGGWNEGYYRAPPVVYGTPYYAPPVVYGPGLSINIR
jgi:hypothetical protein